MTAPAAEQAPAAPLPLFPRFDAPQARKIVVAFAPDTPYASRCGLTPATARSDGRAGAPEHAEARVRHLHKHLGQLDPDDQLWKLLVSPAFTRFVDQPDLLSKAWDSTSGVLLDQSVYSAVLDLVEAPRSARRTTWRLFNTAQKAVKAIDGAAGAAMSPNKVREPLPSRDLWELAVEQLQYVDTEEALMAHLRMLLDLSAHSPRTLRVEMAKRCKGTPAHNTLAAWLKDTKIRRQLSENVLLTMVEVMAETFSGTTETIMARVLEAHRRVYRSLIVARYTDVLSADPIARSLAGIAAQEEALDADDPARAGLRMAREAILTAVAAHRAVYATTA